MSTPDESKDVDMADAEVAATTQCKPVPSGATTTAPRFEIKKWNAVAMWSWDICADTVR